MARTLYSIAIDPMDINFDDYDVVDKVNFSQNKTRINNFIYVKIVQTRRHVISGVSIEVAKAFSKEDQSKSY